MVQKNQSKFFQFPNGGRTRPHMIGAINITETGVVVTDSSAEIMVFIEAKSAAHKKKVSDLIADCCDDGKKFVQPSWAFLSEEVEE